MARKKIQWHPLIIELLRPRVEGYYELRTNMPVGDLPREGDLVLLRRLRAGTPPFDGLWRFLDEWNLVELKGLTTAARAEHWPSLIEVGLGITRRLVEELGHGLPEVEVPFWYLARGIGPRLRREAERLLGRLEAVMPGLWRAWVLGHPVYLAAVNRLPVDEDSLPLHVLARADPDQERRVGEFLAETQARLAMYGAAFAVFHPEAWKEVKVMARQRHGGLQPDFKSVVEQYGWKEMIRQAGEETLIAALDKKKVIQQIGEKEVIHQIGEKEVIRQIGEKEVIREVGPKAFIEAMGIEGILDNLSPAKRRELRRRLAADDA